MNDKSIVDFMSKPNKPYSAASSMISSIISVLIITTIIGIVIICAIFW